MSADIITPQESVRLCELERVIQKHKDAFIECGTALAEIQASKIYRNGFKTFEEYCQKRWDFSYRRAVQMIDAAVAVKNVNHGSDSAPTSERQARPLTKLPAEQQPAAWERAQEIAAEESKPVAARHVEAAVLEVMPKDEPEPVVVDGTQEDEPQPARRPPIKIIEDEGMNIWLLAKSHLDRINKHDTQREQALKACADYCNNRLNSKK